MARNEQVEALVDGSTAALAGGAALPLLTGLALVGVRGELTVADTALALVLTIVAAAWLGGRRVGLVAAVTAAASLNFFHTKPYYSLRISSRNDVLTVVLLLVVGLVVGTMGARQRHALAAARTNRNELGRIHRVAELVAGGADVEDVVHSVEAELLVTLGLRSCTFEALPAAGRRLPLLERNGAVTASDGEHTIGRNGAFTLPADGLEIAVLGRGAALGRMVCAATPGEGVSLERRVAAVALTDQLGAALAARANA